MSALQAEQELVELTPLYTFRTSRGARVAASIQQFNGRLTASLTLQYFDVRGGTWRWTPRGIVIDVALLPELERAVSQLRAAAASNAAGAS
jgi:hypothetical protein